VLGQVEPAHIDVDALQARLNRPDHERVVRSLQEVGFGSLPALLGTYAGQRSDLEPWLENAEINRDGNLRLQYLAGLALNVSMEGTIYNQILSYRRFPRSLFTGSDQVLQPILVTLQGGGR
jgi:spermidine synthase